ncbi:hypothetical protein [Nocardia sp. NPDC058633]|uniref:hypothetical protein n=1 Tax=Nocardia sp. NPDC058633 TaxID=3346568 RepID=UPI0036688C65
MTLLDQALADMRAGLNVAYVATSGKALSRIDYLARERLVDGERMGRRMISGSGDGTVTFCLYSSIPRGIVLDRAYFDHSDVYDEIAPCMATSAASGPRFVHGLE